MKKERGYQTSMYINNQTKKELADLCEYYEEKNGSSMIRELIHAAHVRLHNHKQLQKHVANNTDNK